MPDGDPGAAEPQGGTTAQPQAGTSSSPATGGAPAAPANGAAAASGTGDPAVAEQIAALTRERDEARREAAKHRTELNQTKAAAEAATKTVEQRIADLERTNREYVDREREAGVTSAILAIATRLGFRSPDLAAPLIRPQVELDENGKPRNAESLLRALLAKDPYLGKTTPDYGGGTRGPSPQGSDMNALIRRAAGRQG